MTCQICGKTGRGRLRSAMVVRPSISLLIRQEACGRARAIHDYQVNLKV